MRGKRVALGILLLLAGLVVGTGLSWQDQQRRDALNRQLIAALIKGDDKQAIALVNEGADPNTPYKPAPVSSLLELVKRLFHRSPSAVNDSHTAFLIACGASWRQSEVPLYFSYLDDDQLVQVMLVHGAPVNTKDQYGMTPLLWAVGHIRLKTVNVLLKYGAGVNVQNPIGMTPLIVATQCGNMRLVPPLLVHGANVKVKDRDGRTALHWAIWAQAGKSLIGQLLTYGADPNGADRHGMTPLKEAQRAHRPDLIALLKQYGARDTGQRL